MVATMDARRTRMWSWISIGGALYYAASVLALHALEPQMSPAESFISDYVIARPWLTTTTFLGLAVALGALAVTLKGRLSGRGAKIGTVALWVATVGVLAAGAFPADGVDPPETLVGTLHVVAGLVAFPAMCVAVIGLSASVRRDDQWKDLGLVVTVLGILVVATFLATMGYLFDRGLGGLGQRALFVFLLAWVVIIAGRQARAQESDFGAG